MARRMLSSVLICTTVIVASVVIARAHSARALAQAAQASAQVAVDPDDIGGTVVGPKGAEAGVWVIAETRDLGTPFVRIVVTDDAGRYLIPDLPKANYRVWSRGYGLVDSEKTAATPGQTLRLTAVPAPTPQAAAQYFPAGLTGLQAPIPGGKRRRERAESLRHLACGLGAELVARRATA